MWRRVEDVVWEQDGEFSASVRNLAAVHTLSVENFLKQAKEWGGMPLPSVAITRMDRPYDWEVDHEPMVMLVGRPEMVDPEGGAEVYARDAWMGRMPEVEEERGEDGKVRRFFYDENDEKVEATLENMTGYLMRWKQKGNSAQETPDAARSLMARRLRSMEEVKGRRRMLQAEPENRVTDEEIYEWMNMATDYDWGWNERKARTLFRVLAEVDDVTKGNVLAAIEGSEEADLMELQNGLEEDSAFIRETVRVMKEMRKERRNYVEATPRRVVGMDEWAYAVYQDDVPGRDEVRRVCREHGIVPVEYKAGERDKALGDLIDDGEVSFRAVDGRLLEEVRGSFREEEKEGGEKRWVLTGKKGKRVVICGYPDVLKRIVPWERNVVAANYIVKKLLNEHDFTPEDVARLPYALWDPIAVFEEVVKEKGSKEGKERESFVVVTDIRTRDKNGKVKDALVILMLREDAGGARITDLKTAYAPDAANRYVNLLEGKALRYVDKARARRWGKEEGSTIFQLLTTSLGKPGSGVMLKENMGDVNFNFAESEFSGSIRLLRDGGEMGRVTSGLEEAGRSFKKNEAFVQQMLGEMRKGVERMRRGRSCMMWSRIYWTGRRVRRMWRIFSARRG